MEIGVRTIRRRRTSVTLIAKNASWEYRKGTAEATPSPNAIGAWRGLDYVEDSNWKTGTLPIGYAPAGGPTMKTSLTDMSGGYSSVFLRKTFYIPDPAEALGLTLQAMYDDGFNVWINGRLAQIRQHAGRKHRIQRFGKHRPIGIRVQPTRFHHQSDVFAGRR